MAVSCIRCRHSLIDREGRCKQEIRQGPFSNRFSYCGCKCQFPNEAPLVKDRRYTAGQIAGLARDFLQESPLTDKLTPELILSSFTLWLAKREQEKE